MDISKAIEFSITVGLWLVIIVFFLPVACDNQYDADSKIVKERYTYISPADQMIIDLKK